MKKTFRLEELDCAHCASKIETAIKKIAGVEEASVNFVCQKLSLSAEEADFERVLAESERVIRRIEPDCRLVR